MQYFCLLSDKLGNLMPSVSGPGPSLRTQWLGESLRELRKRSKLSLKYAGKFLQRDASTMSRYESGEFPVRRVDLLELLSLYGVSDEKQRDNLLELCEESWRKGWWDQHRDDLNADFINIPWLESRASQICAYQHLNVHGLLQTRAYAESLVHSDTYPPASADQLNRWLEFRLERQRILSNSKQLCFTMIMEESALYRPIGTSDIMHEQLEYLVDIAEQSNAEVRIIETSVGSHLANTGSFVLYKLPEPYPEVANVETLSGSVYVEEPQVRNFQIAWDDLQDKALDAQRSTTLIKQRMKEYA